MAGTEVIGGLRGHKKKIKFVGSPESEVRSPKSGVRSPKSEEGSIKIGAWNLEFGISPFYCPSTNSTDTGVMIFKGSRCGFRFPEEGSILKIAMLSVS